jgi:type I restriction enzyme, S subunit
MSEWEEKKLADLCSRIVSGGTPLKARPEFYENGTIPWLKTGEVKKNYVYETEEKITQQGLDNSSAKLIPKNSVIIAMYGDGDTAGNVAINKIPLATNQACCNLILNEEIAFYRFIYFYLKGSYNNLVNLKLGGSQQNLNAKTIKDFSVRIPPLPVQRKIAAILSAYDDLIKNCDRRITLLEKMAEEIYREWFVRLRFPGHEQTTFHKGIPEGWEIVKLNDAVLTKNGKSIELDDTGIYKVYGSNGVIGRAKKHNAENSIIIGRVGAYCGSVQFERNKLWATDNTIIATANSQKTNIYWCFFLLKFLNLRNFAGGSAQPLLTQSLIGNIEILLAPQIINLKFEKYVKNIFSQLEILNAKISNLKQTRDRLLTRLISGKLSVEDLDIQFPPSMIEDLPHEQ